jgi:hypothetical protein
MDPIATLAHLRATLLGLSRWADRQLDAEDTDRQHIAEHLSLAVLALALDLEAPELQH